MRIAIVELYEHWEVVDFLRRVLHAHALEFYLSAEVAAHAGLVDVDPTEVLGRGADRTAVTRAVVNRQDRFDVVVVCTRNVDHRPWEPFDDLRIPVVLLLHDAAFAFDDGGEQLGDVFSRLRRWRWWLAGSWSRRLLRDQSRWAGFVTSAPGGAAFIKTMAETRPCLVSPYAFAPALPLAAPNERADDRQPLHIVLPGSVDPNHRNYDPVLAALSSWRGRRLHVTLPGQLRNPGAPRITAAFEALATERLTIATRNVRESLDYAAALAKADILLAPIRPHVYYATQRERVGVTKGLGALDDQIRFAKPALVPEGIPTWPELEAVTQRYADASALASRLQGFVPPTDGKPFRAYGLTQLADRWSGFLLEVVRQRFRHRR